MKNELLNDCQLNIAMIMAAGYGTRMGCLTENLPKPLLPLNSQFRIIEVIIHKLAKSGIKRIIINLHYLPDQMKSILGDGSHFGVELLFSNEPEILGSGGGIAKAEPYFKEESILVVNADTLCGGDISALFLNHCQAGNLATMLVLPSRNNHDYTLVLFDQENKLQGFLGKDEPIPPQYQTGVFTGYQILSPQARAYLKPEKQSVMSCFYQQALKQQKDINIFPLNGSWIDIGTELFYHNLVKQIHEGEMDLNEFMR